MPLKNYWAETVPVYGHEDLTANADSTTHAVTYQVVIPTSSHIKKLVCSAGMAIRGQSAEDIQNLGMPMTWVHRITMTEESSDAFPSGRAVTLNVQAGAFQTSQCSQRRLAPPVGNNETLWGRVVTNYCADIHPIDQGMSYGSVNQNIGDRVIYASFYVRGVHGTTGNPYASTPYYQYWLSGMLRVLYERTVA